MSLFELKNNRAEAKREWDLLHGVVARNRRNESFGESFMADAAELAGPASDLTLNIYRKKALKMLDKRNAVCGNQNPYINELCGLDINGESNETVYANLNESYLFTYIANLCKVDIAIHERNMKCGNVSEKITEMYNNRPSLRAPQAVKGVYCTKIIGQCKRDMLGF